MKALTIQLLICLAVIAAQSFYVTAHADSVNESANNVLALARPSTAEMATCKNAVIEESHLAKANDQFVPGVAIYGSNIGGDEASRLARDGVYIGSNSKGNFIELQGGNVLFNPENDVVISTGLGKIFIGAGATAFVVNSGEDVVIYDLLQTKPKQVSVIVVANNKQRIVMEPGRMLVLTGQDTNDFEKLAIDCHRVAYRNAQPILKPNGSTKTFEADFSVASAMTSIQPLKRLTVSKNREDNLAVERMLKGAVLLGDFSTTPQPFTDTAPTTVQAQPTAEPVPVVADHNQ